MLTCITYGELRVSCSGQGFNLKGTRQKKCRGCFPCPRGPVRDLNGRHVLIKPGKVELEFIFHDVFFPVLDCIRGKAIRISTLRAL